MHDVLSKIGPTNDSEKSDEEYELELLKKVSELNAKLLQAEANCNQLEVEVLEWSTKFLQGKSRNYQLEAINSQLEVELSTAKEIRDWTVGFLSTLAYDFVDIEKLLHKKLSEIESKAKERIESKELESNGV